MLRLLKIPKRTYYFDWVNYVEPNRHNENMILKALLRDIWQNNYKDYGAPHMRLSLPDLNLYHGTKRIRRLMPKADIYSVMSRLFNKLTTQLN